MPKPKADQGKSQNKGPNESEVQFPPEPADHAMADNESSRETDAESSNILLAIKSMNKTVTERFDTLEATLATTQATLVSLGNRVAETEEANSSYDHCLTQVEQTCMKLQAENDALHSKVIDLKARSRHQNIRIISLPEKIKNGRPAEFLTEFIPELLGANNFSSSLVVDQAHRLGKQPSGENT